MRRRESHNPLVSALVVAGVNEFAAVLYARARNPAQPDYLTPSFLALGMGLLAAIIDPPLAEVRYGAWVAPDGEVIDVGKESHAVTALSITGPLDAETIETIGGDKCRGWGLPEACTAQVILGSEGYARYQHGYDGISIELFAPLTNPQRRVLAEAIADWDAKKGGADVFIEAADPYTGRTLQSFTGANRISSMRALESASAAAA